MLTLRSVYKDRTGTKILYELLRERSEEDDPHVNISHRALPPYDEHRRFVRAHPYRVWYFVKENGLVAGYVYASKQNEIGIVLSKDYRGRGIGRWAVSALMAKYKPLPTKPGARSGRWLANINPLNARSIAMFSALGFKLLQQTYVHEEDPHGKDEARPA